MDGVHDLGGREGFGSIADKTDDKVIHADWEIRDFAMKQSSAAAKSWTIDWFRHCRELADPVEYQTPP
jgi:nitrile hydratase subunit beta